MKIAVRIALVVVVLVVGYFAYESRSRSDLNNMGVKYMNEGNYKDAVDRFEMALAQDPNNEKIKQNLAKAREELAASGADVATSGTVKPAAGAAAVAGAPKSGAVAKATDAQLRERIAARVAKLKAAGWKNEDNVTLDQMLTTADALEQIGNTNGAITTLEHALFRDPNRLDIEQKIEVMEAKGATKK